MTVLFNIQFTLSLLAMLPPVFPERVPTNKFSEEGESWRREFEIQLRRESYFLYLWLYLLLCLKGPLT